MTPELQTTLDNLPDRPGVYLMKDERGEVIYVGKAQSLRSRVRSYWQKGTTAGQIHLIREVIDKVAELDYTITDSDSEALPPRSQPHQAPSAALQHPAQGRQELPVHQDHARRRLPAGRADPPPAERREPLLRAVRIGDVGRRVDEPRPPPLPVPDLHDRHQGRRPGAPAAVPAVPHQALPGPVHPGDRQGGLPRRHHPDRAVPGGPPGDARQGPPLAR